MPLGWAFHVRSGSASTNPSNRDRQRQGQRPMTAVQTETMTKTFTITVPGARTLGYALGNVALFAATDSTVPALEAVHFEPAADGIVGIVLTATNRYVLGSATLEDATCPEAYQWKAFSLGRAECIDLGKRLSKAQPWQAAVITVTTSPAGVVQSVTIADGIVTSTHVPVDGEFPRWRALLPERGIVGNEATNRIAFDPKFLAIFAKLKGFKSNESVRLTMPKDSKPMRFDIGNMVGVVMPVRLSEW